MASELLRLGSSIPVPNVQELARKPMVTVPPRYLRPDQDPPVITNANSLPTIPVIDLNNLLSAESMDSESARLHSACKDWGFFQLTNHGVTSSLVEKIKLEIQEFFKLPLEEKRKFWQEPGDLEGFGQAFVLSEDQKLDWADMFYITTLPMHLRRPNLFPKLPLPLRETLDAYSLELKNLTMILLEQIAKALQMKAEEMRELLEDGIQSMRINYYPPCPQPELVVGLTPHSDFVVLTILLQVNEVEGLEIRKQGMWIPVKPLPNAFIVNVGDIMEIVTNGAYRSVEHRATVNSVKERLSVATFYFPNFEREIGPAPSLISPQNPAVFRRVGMEKFFKGYFTRELSDKSTLDNVRIEDGEGSSSRSN
ncbi:PREDICTED: protein SRG1-like [Nelumbo nucifera]|uniref:Protein SRG1-like n=1 Tax=Nelumbo nucifera TaxID=4432 RepID=A0A1U8B2E9_NELNU|nr:PREDICTED: protein SRG1-like [Nelumbo nucifera]XP_010273387.1 PREDICTED: protein SRG1-like [Nelumbo nucifera]